MVRQMAMSGVIGLTLSSPASHTPQPHPGSNEGQRCG
jgi:hypothetical protein